MTADDHASCPMNIICNLQAREIKAKKIKDTVEESNPPQDCTKKMT